MLAQIAHDPKNSHLGFGKEVDSGDRGERMHSVSDELWIHGTLMRESPEPVGQELLLGLDSQSESYPAP